MQIDTVVFFQITDPKLFAYGVENPIMAIENLSATTLRNIIGDMELDETLTSREVINTKMRAALDLSLIHISLVRVRLVFRYRMAIGLVKISRISETIRNKTNCTTLPAPATAAIPVSYTHLDVYKRQDSVNNS